MDKLKENKNIKFIKNYSNNDETSKKIIEVYEYLLSLIKK